MGQKDLEAFTPHPDNHAANMPYGACTGERLKLRRRRPHGGALSDPGHPVESELIRRAEPGLLPRLQPPTPISAQPRPADPDAHLSLGDPPAVAAELERP